MNYAPWRRTLEEDSMSEGAQRQRLFTNLLNALWTPPEEKKSIPGTFAAGEAVKHSEGFILNSFHVEGAGLLRLPLSAEDTSKLQSVCQHVATGKSCWQVDASKITFPWAPEFLSNTIQRLAMKAVGALGVHGATVEVHLHKLLFYEPGGQFAFHRETEEEKRMFAVLILQLPTEDGYTGGKQVVKSFNTEKKFDCHMVSGLGFCYTIFFADCEHELRKIESGSRLCLAFKLEKRVSSSDPPLRELSLAR